MDKMRMGTACLIAAMATVPTTAAIAQDAASASPPRQDNANAFADIIVTAQRRQERLSEAPIAVTAISSESLAKQAINSETDLQLAVPGLTVRATFNSDQLNYSIRGQSVDPFSSSQPGVLPYFNEFQVPSGYSASALYDLQSIQVLKGPQGTLFGRNATGGAVLITSAPPTDSFEGYVRGRVGDYDFREAEGAINVPLGTIGAFRLSGKFGGRSGFFRNLTTGTSMGQSDTSALRGSLRLDPSSRFSNTLVVDYIKRKGTSVPGRPYSQYPTSASAGLFSRAFIDGTFGPGAFDTYAASIGLPKGIDGITQYFESVKGAGPNDDVRVSVDPVFYGRTITVVNTSTLELSDTLKLKNIFGYADSKSSLAGDSDGTPFVLQNAFIGSHSKSLSEELQLSGKLFADRFDFITGAYYYHSRNFQPQAALAFDLSPFAQLGGPFYSTDTTARDRAIAVYAQGTYDLGDLLWNGIKVTFGGRYTNERVSLVQEPSTINSFYQRFGPAPEERTFDKFSWQAGLEQRTSRAFMMYGKVRTSFRSGGFNVGGAPLPGNVDQGGNGFKVENTMDFELGAKFDGSLAGAPIRANLALYHQKVEDVQRIVYAAPPGGGLAGFTVNIPEAIIKGIEFDLTTRLARWLDIGGAATYTDAKFTKPTAIVFGAPKTYGPYADTPEFSTSAFVDAHVDLPGAGTLSVRADVYHQSALFFGSLNDTTNPGTRIDGYTVANLRVGLSDIGGSKLSVAAYAKNLLNEKYYVGGVPVGEVLGINSAVPGAPRTWFLEVGYRF